MHRTNHVPRTSFWIMLISLAASGLSAQVGLAQEAQPPARELPPARDPAADARGTALLIPIGGSQRQQMKTKKQIRTVVNSREDIATVQPVQGDPTYVIIQGKQAGTTILRMTDIDGTEETFNVTVQI